MRLHELFGDDDAVSSVVSVILLVAITIILASAVTVFALDIGGGAANTTPSAAFDFEYQDSTGDIRVTHSNGDMLSGDQLRFAGAALEKDSFGGISEWSGGDVNAGDSATVNVEAGETLRLVWQGDSGSETAVLGEYQVSDDITSQSGSISSVQANAGDDDVDVDIGSLSSVGGSAWVVVNNGGSTTGESVTTGENNDIDSIGSFDPGDSVDVTLYESSNENLELDTESDTAAGASVCFVDGDVNGDVTYDLTSITGTSQVFVVIDDDPDQEGDSPEVSEVISGTGEYTDSLDGDNVGAGEAFSITVYESSDESNELAAITEDDRC